MKIQSRNAYIIYLLVVGVCMLWMQLLDAFTLSDDMAYRFVWHEDEREPLEVVGNFSDLIRSQWVHYYTVNGRWVVHSVAQALLSFAPLQLYQIISALLFVWLLYLGARLTVGSKQRLFASVLICFFLFVVSAGFRTTMLWSMGTFNYLWTTTFTLAFLLYLKRLGPEKATMKHWLLAPLSLFVGCSHEALALPVAITFVVYFFAERKTVFRRAVFPYMCWYMVGMATLLLSPALWVRADSGMTIGQRFISGGINLFFNMRIAWLLLLTIIFLYRKNRALLRQKCWEYRYVYLCLVMSLGIIAVCGTNLERVAFFTDFIALLLLVELWSTVVGERWQRHVVAACTVIMALLFVPAIWVRSENYCYSEKIRQQLMEPGKELIAVEQPQKGASCVMDFFRERYVYPSVEFGFYCCYMAFNADDSNIREAAKLYNKRQLTFLPADVVNRMATDSTAYVNYELDANKELYVWRMDQGRQVESVVFNLKPEDTSALWPHQRLLAYHGDTYVMDDHHHYSVVKAFGRYYLVFTRPTTNVYRRIDTIEWQ
ncbi:MAG: hypothetical protein J5552_01200 [Prevotella sp.]|nr:hypothetical protein [Prevotella sp.]